MAAVTPPTGAIAGSRSAHEEVPQLAFCIHSLIHLATLASPSIHLCQWTNLIHPNAHVTTQSGDFLSGP